MRATEGGSDKVVADEVVVDDEVEDAGVDDNEEEEDDDIMKTRGERVDSAKARTGNEAGGEITDVEEDGMEDDEEWTKRGKGGYRAIGTACNDESLENESSESGSSCMSRRPCTVKSTKNKKNSERRLSTWTQNEAKYEYAQSMLQRACHGWSRSI